MFEKGEKIKLWQLEGGAGGTFTKTEEVMVVVTGTVGPSLVATADDGRVFSTFLRSHPGNPKPGGNWQLDYAPKEDKVLPTGTCVMFVRASWAANWPEESQGRYRCVNRDGSPADIA